METLVLDNFRPDLTLVLDLPAEVGAERATARGGEAARFEQFDAAFHERLRQAFLAIAQRDRERCVVIDASADPEAVATAVWTAVAQRFRL